MEFCCRMCCLEEVLPTEMLHVFFVAATELRRATFGRLWQIGCRDTDLHSGRSYGAVLARHQKKNSEAVGKLGFQDLCRLRATEGEG